MRIGNPIGSLQAQRQLSTITKAFARSLERLSSGKRINSAKDGAAELAISSGLEAQQRGLRQVVRNMNDAKGYAETLAGVISTQTQIIQRMKELALQSANGILDTAQRSYLNTEFTALYSEFARLSEQTEFNGEKLADGSFITKKIQAGTKKGETIDLALPSLRARDVFVEARSAGTFDSGYLKTPNPNDFRWNNPGDLNNDGFSDFVAAASGSTYVRLSQGDGTFSAAVTIFSNSGMTGQWTTIGDFNGDGFGDIAQTTTGGVLITALGNGDGTFQAISTYISNTGSVREANIGDINGDGKMDIAVADYTTGGASISLYYGNGDGSFAARVTIAATGHSSYGVHLVDIDENGTLDIIGGGNNRINIFNNQGNGTFNLTQIVHPGNFLDSADLNSDGNVDLLFTKDTYFGFTLGNGDGTFQAPVTYNIPGSEASDIQAVDLNSDNILDVIISDDTSALTYYAFGRGDGSFSTVRTLSSVISQTVFAEDTNDDGAIDIVTTGGGYTQTFLGNIEYKEALEKMTIATQDAASDVLAILDNGLSRLATANASLGAVLNRLDSAQAVSVTLNESLSQARSQIEDTDYSQEMAEFTRLQILQSAAIAVMNQNQLNMKLVLKLLS